MMITSQLRKLAPRPISTTLRIVAISSARMSYAGDLRWDSWCCSWGAMCTSSEGSAVVGRTLRSRSVLGIGNRVRGGPWAGGGELLDEFTGGGTDGEGTGEDKGEGEACFVGATRGSISGTVKPG